MCDGGTFQYSGGRDAYVARHTFSQQLRYTDPTDAHLHLLPMPINHLLLDNDTVTIAQVQFSYTIDLSDWKRIYLVCTPNGMGVLVAKAWVLCVITAGSNNNSMEGRANSRGTHGGTQCHPCSPWSQRSNHMHEVIRLVFFICSVTFLASRNGWLWEFPCLPYPFGRGIIIRNTWVFSGPLSKSTKFLCDCL